MEIDRKTYKVMGRYIHTRNRDKKNKKEYMVILYFIDDTENIKLQQEYKDSKSCVGIIMIDNYEEIMQRLDASEKPQITAEIDKEMYDWANKANGVLIKSDRDRYVYFFEQRYLEEVKADKFSILDKIKDINTHEKVQLTLSIAISNEGNTDKEKYQSAQAGMDIVLGRGGDQAVIRENEIYKFFGGRVEEREKRTEITQDMVIKELAKIAFLDIRKLYTENGQLKNVADIDDDTAGAISSLETLEEYDGYGEDREKIGDTQKVKLLDKTKALELLGRHLGIFNDKLDVNVKEKEEKKNAISDILSQMKSVDDV